MHIWAWFSYFILLREGNQVLFIIRLRVYRLLGLKNVRAFHESPDRIYIDLTCINP